MGRVLFLVSKQTENKGARMMKQNEKTRIYSWDLYFDGSRHEISGRFSPQLGVVPSLSNFRTYLKLQASKRRTHFAAFRKEHRENGIVVILQVWEFMTKAPDWVTEKDIVFGKLIR